MVSLGPGYRFGGLSGRSFSSRTAACLAWSEDGPRKGCLPHIGNPGESLIRTGFPEHGPERKSSALVAPENQNPDPWSIDRIRPGVIPMVISIGFAPPCVPTIFPHDR